MLASGTGDAVGGWNKGARQDICSPDSRQQREVHLTRRHQLKQSSCCCVACSMCALARFFDSARCMARRAPNRIMAEGRWDAGQRASEGFERPERDGKRLERNARSKEGLRDDSGKGLPSGCETNDPFQSQCIPTRFRVCDPVGPMARALPLAIRPLIGIKR
jgi:hypothetical protein